MKGVLQWVKGHYKPLVSALLFAALALFLLLGADAPDEIEIAAVYDEQDHTLQVEQTIRYVNRSELELDSVYLYLHANAFATRERAPVLASELLQAYPEGFSEGYASVEKVFVSGEPAAWARDGPRHARLLVALDAPLGKGERVELELSYTLQLPKNRLRFGYSEKDVRLLNAFAIPAYHDGSAWQLHEYSAIGDPFVSTVADYTVTLQAPSSFVAAGPGLQGEGEDGVWRFKARDLREFALVLCKDYCVAQAEGAGLTVRAFAYDQEEAQALASLGAQAVEVFSELFGALSQDELLLCAGDFALGGMEYPGLVLLDRQLLQDDDGMLEFVVAHEAAHQWWYAAVGSDQVNHPWQDEALTEYSTLLYYEAVYGRESMESLYRSMIQPVLEGGALEGVNMDSPLSAFETNAFYDALIYRKGAAMWHDIRVLLGNDGFLDALRKYHRQYAGKLAPPEALLQLLGKEGSQRALEWIAGQR